MARSKSKSNRGRPSEYKREFARRTAHLIYLGLNVREICVNLDIHSDTYYRWLKENEHFAGAVAKAREADGNVANSLRKRATGFVKETEKLFHFQGSVIRARVKEYYPPDVGAASKWLKVKHPDKWGDHIGSLNGNGADGNANIFVDAETMALAGADVDTPDDDGTNDAEDGAREV